MATAAICGSAGSVTGATGATEVSFWEITLAIDAVEATSFASAGWKERVPCLRGASGSFKSIGSSSTVGKHNACAFIDQIGHETISGTIVISKITVGTPVDGIISFNHEFSFTGTVTAATLI